MVEFYSHVFDMEITEQDDTYALLLDGQFELVLLETEKSKNVPNSLIPRENIPIKPVFFTDINLEKIKKKIQEKSGTLYLPKKWEFGGRIV